MKVTCEKIISELYEKITCLNMRLFTPKYKKTKDYNSDYYGRFGSIETFIGMTFSLKKKLLTKFGQLLNFNEKLVKMIYFLPITP